MAYYLLMCRKCCGTSMFCKTCRGFNVRFRFEPQHGAGSAYELNQLQKVVSKRKWKLFYLGNTIEGANNPNNVPKEVKY